MTKAISGRCGFPGCNNNSAELQTLIVKLKVAGSLGFVLLLSSFICLLQSLVTLGPVQIVKP
jgi:hypothetical protein